MGWKQDDAARWRRHDGRGGRNIGVEGLQVAGGAVDTVMAMIMPRRILDRLRAAQEEGEQEDEKGLLGTGGREHVDCVADERLILGGAA